MSAASTARVARFRERQRAGRMLLKIEVDGTVADDLCEAGLLKAWDSEDPQKVAEAVQTLLKLLPARTSRYLAL